MSETQDNDVLAELRDRIEAQAREIERLRGLLKDKPDAITIAYEDGAHQRLSRRVAALTDALRPFANESYSAGPDHEFVTVKISDCDNAARAIAGQNTNSAITCMAAGLASIFRAWCNDKIQEPDDLCDFFEKSGLCEWKLPHDGAADDEEKLFLKPEYEAAIARRASEED